MKKYAVAFISFHDNELKIQFIISDSEKGAIFSLYPDYFDSREEFDSMELNEIKQRFFDADSMVEAREIV